MPFDTESTVNVAECLALADFLETLPDEQFDMGSWIHKTYCGTVACVAGWIAIRAGVEPAGYRKFGADKLGITDDQAWELFFGVTPEGTLIAEWLDATPRQAAFALRHLAATGKVDIALALES